MSQYPDFDDLPMVEGMPRGCTWGLFDKNGKKDVYGTLNFLTPDHVKAAIAEVKDGKHISLNWPITGLAKPGFGRKGLVHKPSSLMIPGIESHGFDDEIEFNTQVSTQWDSLVHFNHQASACAYNGTKLKPDMLEQAFGQEDKDELIPTLQHWHKRGGMVTRGVLIDFKSYADRIGRKFNPFACDVISIEDIETIAKEQGIEFRHGDVLIIRSGFTEALSAMNAEEQATAMGSHRVCGVEGTVKAAKWIWNHRFAAVAGDMIAFEHIPVIYEDGPKKGQDGEVKDLVLHQYLIALMGMSIGELFDLKELAEYCAKVKRWSFMLTSVPLNINGLVGSPPNAIAIL